MIHLYVATIMHQVTSVCEVRHLTFNEYYECLSNCEMYKHCYDGSVQSYTIQL